MGVKKPRGKYHHGTLREAAIAAAALEVDARGHVAFSLERVAKRLGVTPAALYRHFRNRDALLREVIWTAFERFVERLDAAATAPADDVIFSVGRAYIAFAAENPGWFRLQFSRAGRPLSDRQARARPLYGEALEREIASLFRDDPDAAQRWYLALWAVLHGAAAMCVEQVLPPLTTDAARIAAAEQQLTTFLTGMRAAAPRRPRRKR